MFIYLPFSFLCLGTDRLLHPRGGGGGGGWLEEGYSNKFSKRLDFGGSLLKMNKM